MTSKYPQPSGNLPAAHRRLQQSDRFHHQFHAQHASNQLVDETGSVAQAAIARIKAKEERIATQREIDHPYFYTFTPLVEANWFALSSQEKQELKAAKLEVEQFRFRFRQDYEYWSTPLNEFFGPNGLAYEMLPAVGVKAFPTNSRVGPMYDLPPAMWVSGAPVSRGVPLSAFEPVATPGAAAVPGPVSSNSFAGPNAAADAFMTQATPWKPEYFVHARQADYTFVDMMEQAAAARYQAYWTRQAALKDMRDFRQGLGGIPAEGGRVPDGGTLTRLDTGESSFYGINAHGQPRLIGSDFNWAHAEIDALQQGFMAGKLGPSAIMYVDNALCKFCRRIDGLPQALRELKMKELIVHDPISSWRVTPHGVEQIPWRLR